MFVYEGIQTHPGCLDFLRLTCLVADGEQAVLLAIERFVRRSVGRGRCHRSEASWDAVAASA